MQLSPGTLRDPNYNGLVIMVCQHPVLVIMVSLHPVLVIMVSLHPVLVIMVSQHSVLVIMVSQHPVLVIMVSQHPIHPLSQLMQTHTIPTHTRNIDIGFIRCDGNQK